MPFDLTRILLLLMTLTLNGQAFAAPCGSRDAGSGEHHQTATSARIEQCAQGAHQHHCHQGGDTEAAEPSPASSCEQACSCCPGHCASAIPAAEHTEPARPIITSITLYNISHSAPLPETTLRPPILL
ncbi:hypothetical protein [Microbulbifer sp. HZ11]|uniref:hypothetical protein n=1 Tax=Microbulbifer sp. HZ11 TaxID=1453501 RepID=UPI0012DDC7FB|nr:hypothetical protein [Microbulbifer sp. HZ11]